MSSPAPLATGLQARRLAELHRVAQERLGVTAAYTAYTAWTQLESTDPSKGFQAWLDGVQITVTALRKVSRRLAARYYTLARAIGTGFAYPDIDQERTTVTTGTLFEEFSSVLNEVIEATSIDLEDVPQAEPDPESVEAGDPQDRFEEKLDALVDILTEMFAETAPEQDGEQWNEALESEDFDWEDFLSDVDEDDPGFLEDLYADLDNEAMTPLENKVKRELANDQTISESMKRIEKAKETTGAIASGLIDQAVLKPGRQLVSSVGEVDKRRYAWQRVCGVNPCAFCAMLASRGAVYRTAETAGFQNVYHPNCHCYQIPVYKGEPWYSATEQYFIDNWKPVTDGFSGKDALNAWRRWLRAQYKQQLVPEQALFSSVAQAT